MKYIKKEELIEGEIYTHNNGNIVKYQYLNNYDKVCGIHIGNAKSRFTSDLSINEGSFTITELRLATSEEKHWLLKCIKLDKFTTFEEAMKTFVPEYVECIEETNRNFYGKLGTIYKVSNWIHSSNDCMLEGTTSGSTDRRRFKPSTKEAYDTQFIVNEPEFVLPEKWCVKVTYKNLNYFKSLLNYKTFNLGHWSSITGLYTACDTRNVLKKHKEITFEQFKKYVLKEEIIEEKVIEPLPQFKVIETIETITKVENNEGNQFFIGDTITPIEGFNKGNKFIISGFRYNNAKTNICAITDTHLPNGIGIDKIEHYIEPKVEVKDEFILPEKWCIKNTNKLIGNHFNSILQTYCYTDGDHNNCYLHSYNLFNEPLLKGSRKHFSNYCIKKGFTEITLDEFKKYILKQ